MYPSGGTAESPARQGRAALTGRRSRHLPGEVGDLAFEMLAYGRVALTVAGAAQRGDDPLHVVVGSGEA